MPNATPKNKPTTKFKLVSTPNLGTGSSDKAWKGALVRRISQNDIWKNRKNADIPLDFLANIDPLTFGIHDKLTEAQRKSLIKDIYGNEEVFEYVSKNAPKTEPVPAVAEEQLDDDCYFPKDGYDYEQHLATINPQHFIPAPQSPHSDVHAVVHHNVDSLVDFPQVGSTAPLPSTEVDQVVAALENEASDLEPLDDDFVMQAMENVDISEALDTSALLWGDAKPVKKVHFMLEEDEYADVDEGGANSADGVVQDDDDALFSDALESNEEIDAIVPQFSNGRETAMNSFYRKYVEPANRRAKEEMSILDPTDDTVDTVLKLAQAYTSDDDYNSFSSDDSQYSDDSEKWDVETVLTTRTNATNHPQRITSIVKLNQNALKCKRENGMNHAEALQESDEDEPEGIVLPSFPTHRDKNETPEQRRERKSLVRQAKRMMMEIKRRNKLALKEAKKGAAQEMARGGYDVASGIKYLKL